MSSEKLIGPKQVALTLNVNNLLDKDAPIYRLVGSTGVLIGSTLGRFVQFGVETTSKSH